ncbi:MAG: rhodanese-like domain-containing protein [Bacteroidales bacterium]|nr:rhodanese-like domain-containing protein [Bacteroidales bacterium]
MKKLIISLISTFLLLGLPSVYANTSDTSSDKLYPNRKFYPQLSYISTEQMVNAVSKGKYNVVDARPTLAYSTLHIKEAENFSVGDKQFNEKIMLLINKNNKPIVFYCGGLACLKSYKASNKTIQELQKRDITREVYTYDSGISAFAHASPEWVLKNGKEVSPENPLLDMTKIKKHAKSAADFTHAINTDEENQYIILDVREKNQQMLRKLFTFKREKKLTLLNPEKMTIFLNTVKGSGKTLMVYGSVEKQIESLYPLIQTAGIKRWYYLEGGEVAYSKYMIKQHVTN